MWAISIFVSSKITSNDKNITTYEIAVRNNTLQAGETMWMKRGHLNRFLIAVVGARFDFVK